MDPLLEVFCALFVGFILILGSKKLLPILGKSGEGGGGGDGVQNKDEQLDADEEDEVAAASSSAAVSRKKGGKKAVAPTRQRDAKNKFSHPWLLCSLKAHNDTILDMQFSPHGKYLATCAEDESSSSCSEGAGVVMCSTTASTTSSPSSSLSSSTESLSSSSSETSPAEHVTAPAMYSATIVVTASSAEPVVVSSETASTTTTSPSLSPSTSSSSLPFDESPTATPSPTVGGSASRRRKKRTKRRPAAKKPSGSASATGSDEVADDSLEVDEQVLDLPAEVVYRVLLGYTLPPDQLHLFGFPQACAVRPGRAYIYRSVAAAASNATSSRAAAAVTLHADAKEFVPRSATLTATVQPAAASTASDSGVADEDSSSCGGDEEESDSLGSSCGMERGGAAAVLRPDCLRCGRSFPITVDGVYVECPPERCVFHWGKLRRRDAASSRSPYQQQQVRHTCCDGRPGSRGCSTSEQHVWSGLLPGLNGPLRGYMCTRLRCSLPAPGAHAGIYALDCEMCFTGRGLQLARVSVVDLGGRRVYDTLVRPEQPVIDYNTRFSGITARQLSTATRTLRAVQSDLMGFISAETLLVGHGLENDLRALRLVHGRVIDTSALFPHYRGLPFRHRLSHLTASCLKRRIQADGVGHDSLQDARACMQLLLWRVRNDLGLNAV